MFYAVKIWIFCESDILSTTTHELQAFFKKMQLDERRA